MKKLLRHILSTISAIFLFAVVFTPLTSMAVGFGDDCPKKGDTTVCKLTADIYDRDEAACHSRQLKATDEVNCVKAVYDNWEKWKTANPEEVQPPPQAQTSQQSQSSGGSGNSGVTLLQNNVFGNDALASKEPEKYLQNIYVTAIGLAGIMAVVILVWGGFELIASPINPQMREEAKKRIWAALGGLLLVLASITILGTINPAFTEFGFKLTPSAQTGTPGGAGAGGVGAEPTIPPSNIKHGEAVKQLETSGISVTSTGNCAEQGRSNCTSLDGVQQSTLDEIKRLSEEAGCNKTTVKCTVTGVREVGHNGGKSHVNGVAFDFGDKDPKVNGTIEKYPKYEGTNTKGENTKGEKQYKNPVSGAVYTREKPPDGEPHWHVTVPTSYKKS